ncbi:AraC family transcriptional regulator [Marinobacter mobilis]|uniref:Helix-turn-helix domain-containing protein n=1 Tax=Marinobacter mobilis TaxID=488533 RepID=A0A1H3D2A6_9GAMM|nr:AraC family transcriptional regulator [Marinobacter mobilis]SDX60527.1 Helix-turn-helix domain-containing protein [Marinobacter mobilis]
MKQHKTIYSYWLKDSLAVMATLGLDVDAITAGLPGLQVGSRQSSSWVEVSVARQLWHNAFEQCRDTALGFKVGKQLSIRAFNVLAPVLSHSPTMAEAIANAMRYQQLLSQSGSFHHTLRKGRLVARYVPAPSHTALHFSQVDSVLAAFVKALRLLLDEQASLHQVTLTGPRRDDIGLYEAFYRCPVYQGGEAAELEFTADLLVRPIIGADPGIYRINQTLAEDRLSRLLNVEQLHNSVAEAVANLKYAQADIHGVARELVLTVRTLQRKLSQSGSSFSLIQDQVMLKEATRLLTETETSVQEIALLMGYTETSSFSRAIRTMTGRSPLQLRQATVRAGTPSSSP